MSDVATMTSKGQMTVPAEVRDDLDLKPGDKVHFAKGTDGVYRFVKVPSLATLSGFIKVNQRVTDEELDRWIAERRGRSTE